MNEKQVFEVRRRRSRQEVEQLIAEYESSGLSRSEFCRERGLSLSTLSRYRKRRDGKRRLAAMAWWPWKFLAGRPRPSPRRAARWPWC